MLSTWLVATGLIFAAGDDAKRVDAPKNDAKRSDAKSDVQRDAHSASATASATQTCRNGKTTTQVIRRVVKDGKVAEDVSGPGELGPAIARALAGSGGAAALPDLAALEKKLNEFVQRALADALAGRSPDPAALQNDLNAGDPNVHAHVEVLSGDEALKKMEQLCPDLRRQIDQALRSVQGGAAPAPRVEAPHLEAPRVVAPRVDAPRLKLPRLEAPRPAKAKAPKHAAPAKPQQPGLPEIH